MRKDRNTWSPSPPLVVSSGMREYEVSGQDVVLPVSDLSLSWLLSVLQGSLMSSQTG